MELAKKQPCQQLCDTVSELLKGTETPSERKTLKRALYLLKVAGFVPSPEIEETNEEPRLPKIGTHAVMLSPDSAGYRCYFFAIVKGAELHYVLVTTALRYQLVDVNSYKLRRWVWSVMRDELMSSAPAPLVGEIDPAYALHRIRREWEGRREDRATGKFSGFWKQLLTHVPSAFPHPAAKFAPSEDLGPDGRRNLMNRPECVNWRLFLPPDDPLWEPIHALRWDEELSKTQRKEMITDLLLNDRPRLASDDEIEDIVGRFLDCALILGEQDPRASEMVHAAGHLQHHRWRSEVFEQLVHHTVEHLEQDLEQDEVECAAFPKSNMSFGLVDSQAL